MRGTEEADSLGSLQGLLVALLLICDDQSLVEVSRSFNMQFRYVRILTFLQTRPPIL